MYEGKTNANAKHLGKLASFYTKKNRVILKVSWQVNSQYSTLHRC